MLSDIQGKGEAEKDPKISLWVDEWVAPFTKKVARKMNISGWEDDKVDKNRSGKQVQFVGRCTDLELKSQKCRYAIYKISKDHNQIPFATALKTSSF